MTILSYKEPANIERLKGMPMQLKVLFALLAALRIFPAYVRFCARTGRGDADVLTEFVERLWRDLNGDPMTEQEIEIAIDYAMDLVPSEEDGWDRETQACAEDAAAAVVYALRTRLRDDPQEAAWAARRVYETAGQFANSTTGELFPGDVDAAFARLSHPVIQCELARQARDLDELAGLSTAGDPSRFLEMRQRSEREAEIFFRPGT